MSGNTLSQTSQPGTIERYVDEPVRILDPRAEGGVTDYKSGENLRMWAATISAGYKENDRPVVVRDGKIRLHEDMGEAPGIREALKLTGGKHLGITMLSNNINDCLKQMFCAWGSTKVFGDENSLTVMRMDGDKQVRKIVPKEDPSFQATLGLCKPSTFVPFALALWDENDAPFMHWPDGFMPYRLRFGSINSARAFVDALQAIKRLTNGQLVGVPLTLSLVYQHKMTPQLKRMQVPVWSIVLKHPRGLAMTSGDMRRVLEQGISDAKQMALPPPIAIEDGEVLEAAFKVDEKIDVDEEALENLETRRTVDRGTATVTRVQDYYRAMQGTPWTDDEMRPVMVQQMADAAGLILDRPSLRLLAEQATVDEWATCTMIMCKASAEHHGTEDQAQAGKGYAVDSTAEEFGAKPATTVATPEASAEKPKPEAKTKAEPVPETAEEMAERDRLTAVRQFSDEQKWGGDDFTPLWERLYTAGALAGFSWTNEFLSIVGEDPFKDLPTIVALIEEKANPADADPAQGKLV